MAALKPRRKARRKNEETALSAAIQQTLTAKGCRVIRINSGLVEAKNGGWIHGAKKGTPDLLVILPMLSRSRLQAAELTFLEVKKKAGVQSADQVEWSEWARLNGVRSFVVRGVTEAISAVFKSEV